MKIKQKIKFLFEEINFLEVSICPWFLCNKFEDLFFLKVLFRSLRSPLIKPDFASIGELASLVGNHRIEEFMQCIIIFCDDLILMWSESYLVADGKECKSKYLQSVA